MKKALLNKAMMATRTIITDLWNGHPEAINTYLADQVVAIGPLEGEFYHTKEQVYEMVKFLVNRMSVCGVTNREIYPIVNENHTCVIVGHFVINVSTRTGDFYYIEESMTLVWKLTKEEQLKICHLHFSTAHHYSRLFESPLEVEHRSYTRNEHHSDEDDLITIKDDQHRIRIISLSAIEYACADGHNTIIYTHEETIHARMRWKEFLSHLDTHFLQVHRSYVVKKESVKLVGKNYLETYSGNKIPVPVKNMHEIVNALTKLKS